jgi:hypothetical protein
MDREETPDREDGGHRLNHRHWHYHGPADHHEHVHPDGFTGGHSHAHNHVEVSLGEFLAWLFEEAEGGAGAVPGTGAEARPAGAERRGRE